jgi:hypothetical protein
MRAEAPEDPSQEESGTEGPNKVNEGPGACEGVAARGPRTGDYKRSSVVEGPTD